MKLQKINRWQTLEFLWRVRQRWLPFAIAVLAIVMIWPGGQNPALFADSDGYLKGATYRIQGYPVFLDVFGSGPLLCYAQTIISVAAWCFFGWVVAGIPGTVAAAGLAVSLAIGNWNLLVLSESLSFSLIVATMGSLFFLLRRWSPMRFTAWGFLSLWMAFIRVGNLYLLPILPLPFLFRPARHLALTAVVALSIYGTTTILCGTRGASYQKVTLTDLVMYRILPDPKALTFFKKAGMPAGPEVMKYEGRRRDRYRLALWADSPAFAAWLKQHGVRTYQRWLLSRPASFQEAWAALRDYRSLPASYGHRAKPPAAMYRMEWWYDLWGIALVSLWLLLVLALPIAEMIVMRKLSAWSLMAVTLALATYAEAFVCYHGECDEMKRLMMPVGLLYRMTLGVALAGYARWAVQWRALMNGKFAHAQHI